MFRRFLASVVQLTPVAAGAAVGMIAVGVLAIVAGNHDHKVVHDQLAPEKIFFPPAGSPALFPDLKQYAGQRVDTAGEARAYANKFIARHLKDVAGGKTYAEVSAAALKNPNDPKLREQTQTLFRGDTLRGLLLNSWGWGTVGSIAIAAGIILVVLGALLFVLPVLNWLLNERARQPG